MTRGELRAACPSNDTGGYIEWLEDRALAAEAQVAELEGDVRRALDGHAEANRVCGDTLDLNDTLLGENARLKKRIAELTADEGPRKAAERIVKLFHERFATGLYWVDMRNAITTAIQAASNAQLERGRKEIAELREDLSRVSDNWLKSLHERSALDHGNHVREFMQKFSQHIGDTPGWPPREVLDLRVKLMAEEFAEMLEAGGYAGNFWIGRSTPESREHASYVTHWHHHPVDVERTVDFPAFIDALLDLEYVILGTHVACGVDPQPIWERVHASNMAKQPAADKFSKITKPDGWQAPDIAGALREQGWQG